MTRLAQRLLALVLAASPLLVLGCSGSSSNKDATPTLPDGLSAKPDVPNVPTPDASVDLAPVPVADGPAVTPDVAVDSLPLAPDSGPVVTPDAAVDVLPVAVDAGPVVTPDGAVDVRPLDSGPVAVVDAAADGPGDGGAVADGSGAATDSSPVACAPFSGGPVTTNLTLTKACGPYVITDDIEVDNNAVLTIEAGATLSFAAGVQFDIGYSSAGKLVAVGTAQSPITLTSAESAPAAGDWSSIHLWDSTLAGTQIAYTKLDYCGSYRDGCIVGDGVKASRVTLDHLTIDHVGEGADGILENDAASNFVITNSTFSNIKATPTQKYAISVQAPSFAGIGATNVFNGGSAIELAGGTVASTTSWSDPGTVVAVTDKLWVEGTGNPILTLGPGMTFKFDAGVEFSVGYSAGGKLVIAGTAAKHVVLTSLAPSPSPGDWSGVEVWDGGKAQISFADISYGGIDGTSGGDLILESGNSTTDIAVDNSSFSYSRGYGIYVDCAIPTNTPLATITVAATVTFAHNAIDAANANTQAANVGPGLSGPACSH